MFRKDRQNRCRGLKNDWCNKFCILNSCIHCSIFLSLLVHVSIEIVFEICTSEKCKRKLSITVTLEESSVSHLDVVIYNRFKTHLNLDEAEKDQNYLSGGVSQYHSSERHH